MHWRRPKPPRRLVAVPHAIQRPQRFGAERVAMSLRLFRSVYRVDRLLMMSAVALCTLASVSCGGGGSTTSQQTPTSPSTRTPSTSPARVQLDSNGQLTGCVAITQRLTRCDFGESGKNIGPGCAVDVRGRVRLVSGEMDVAGQRWLLGSTRVLMPDEQFSYAVKLDATPDELKSVTGYRTEIEWSNTPCP